MNRHCALTLASLLVGLTSAANAMAGTYSKVDQATWQQGVTPLPTYVNMYIFVPATLATKPPILVYTHHCQGDAASSHSSQGAVEKIADTSGFIIIYPEATGQNCWDAGSKRSMKHDGGGDTQAVAQMVKYVISKYSADANRVYAAGDSSGGIMTEALLGVYPDVFMAGVSIMGVPCGCWADGYNDVTGKTGNGPQWSGSCAGGSVTKTAQAWGDLVRSYFPTYKGHRPRLQHWHGETDTTLSYKNVAEDIKEWTNLLGLTEEPSGTEANTPKSGTTHKFWKNSCFTVYETFTLANTGHMVSADANLMTKYFGLDKKDGEDPETAACGPTAVPGGGSGAGGAGGSTGAGGTTGAGGGGGTGGKGGTTGTKTTGNGGEGGASTATTSGTAGNGGSSTPIATTGTGGKGGSTTGTGGKGGTSSSSAASSGGSNGGASSSSSSASSAASSSAGSNSSSSSAQAGSSGSNTGTSTSSGSSGGCAIGGGHQGSAFALLALAMLGLVLRRRRR
jgi:poly(hydroxyalkanoate) depolymerase family esterase